MTTGYVYKMRSDAWVCPKCAALVDDPTKHEEAHEELVTALQKWADLLESAREN